MVVKDIKYAIGVDIGGSHIAAAVVDVQHRKIIPETKVHSKLDSHEDAGIILRVWLECIKQSIKKSEGLPIGGVGISIPGPADYDKGIVHIQGVDKYDKLFAINMRHFLTNELAGLLLYPDNVFFINDAAGFLLGETWSQYLTEEKIAAITLGTGIGSGFMKDGLLLSDDDTIPDHGELFNLPYQSKTVEDWISTRWFLHRYKEQCGYEAANVKEIADQAATDSNTRMIFEEFGSNLGTVLSPVLAKFGTDLLILGGNISKSYPLFKATFEEELGEVTPRIHFAKETENAAILGAVKNILAMNEMDFNKRNTAQFLMPVNREEKQLEGYDVFPSFEISEGTVSQGFESLARELSFYKKVCIDGYVGVDWDYLMGGLSEALRQLGVKNITYSIDAAYKDADVIDAMIAPFLGGDDPVFGRLYEGDLEDFFQRDKLESLVADDDCLSIVYGSGASLCNWDAKLVYVDIPKNEIQYRSRAGWVRNIGAQKPISAKPQYKRMFFVDWPVLNRHKQNLLSAIDFVVDGQFLNDISWCAGSTLRAALAEMSTHAFRARPWFEPGVWGGDWIKNNIDGLSDEVVNYAWSFELIVPENGIVISKKGVNLEVSFDFLMYNDHQAILGDAAKTFGTDFPIRFDFLDTFNGENLSLQCHPKPNFISEQFGEKFTQDETYYILDAADDANVYLGFKEGVNKDEFHQALVKSQQEGKEVEVEKYVQIHPAKKHDLFLIPHGTIHCSGINNLVLEISSTPYIYTFKMYDWMRLDLNGQPRPLNIERGMANLNFDCQGDVVEEEYISKQTVTAEGKGWKEVQLSTHPQHFYEVYRMEFNDQIHVEGNNQCHILSLVEGSQVEVVTGDRKMVVAYAETFVIPSNAGSYTINNLGSSIAKVVKSFVKPEVCNYES
ncbi:Sugar kinase of the NBD/HSP70 family, may contain an N-terminal HTH domain [Zhouia amylolytica]|uniref:Sugar kinase of the NBD/HSP70 family, may contain an N-terminal HTH domain n=1 Tax=Zhouia amylolytica TaxID=376730 RepID=A0A1I6T951_9FLAO|nr:Sugar kinase of the NBD/HSP70 family, may contain an N-terminal HTH domain [Zhouia amylolytica]